MKSDEWIKHVNEAKMQNSSKPSQPTILNSTTSNYGNFSSALPENNSSGPSYDTTQMSDPQPASVIDEADENSKVADDEDEFADGLL